MANDLQGSFHRLKAVGGAYDKRKDLVMNKRKVPNIGLNKYFTIKRSILFLIKIYK